MAAIEVSMNADDINKMVVEAILKSTLGDCVKKEVDKAVATLSQSWNNPLQSVINSEISRIVTTLLHTEYAAPLSAKIKAALEGKITEDFIEKIVMAGLKNY